MHGSLARCSRSAESMSKKSPPLKDHAELERSDIVANNRMNRERVASGSNGYETDLSLNPIEFFEHRLTAASSPAANGQWPNWLDLCCGRGRALLETATYFDAFPGFANCRLIGVDLVDMFDPIPVNAVDAVELIPASLHNWKPMTSFDLITCSHGLHYVGDKLDLLERAVGWLRPGGRLFSNLDLGNLQHDGVAGFDFDELLQRAGFTFSRTQNLLEFNQNPQATKVVNFHLEFVGADDRAGANYTGQEAVNSHYR